MIACWWAALVACAGIAVLIPLSFNWIFSWTDAQSQVFANVEHGMINACHNVLLPGTVAPRLPWYGYFDVFQSGVYDPWRLWPEFHLFDDPHWTVKFPLHLFLVVLAPLVIFPVLPSVIGRRRRKLGLCVKCGYDLTGNESGVCPECGTIIAVTCET